MALHAGRRGACLIRLKSPTGPGAAGRRYCAGSNDDPTQRPPLTPRTSPRRNTNGMDEPTHFEESRFWDLVADWLIAGPEAALRGDMGHADEDEHREPGRRGPDPADS